MQFGQTKQNLAVDTLVIIGGVSGPLAWATGKVLGKPFTDAVFDSYIVLLDEPIEGQKAVVIPESCLCRVNEYD